MGHWKVKTLCQHVVAASREVWTGLSAAVPSRSPGTVFACVTPLSFEMSRSRPSVLPPGLVRREPAVAEPVRFPVFLSTGVRIARHEICSRDVYRQKLLRYSTTGYVVTAFAGMTEWDRMEILVTASPMHTSAIHWKGGFTGPLLGVAGRVKKVLFDGIFIFIFRTNLL